MLIVIAIYAALIWLVFFKFKWLPFSWTFGSFAAVIGLGIVLVFMGLLSFLTPTGKIEVIGKVAEIAPNVSGQVVDIPVRHNVVVKSGDVLFQIDQAPYQYKVRQLKAALAEAQQKVSQLKANVEAATADVEAVRAQFERANQRRMDTERLVTARPPVSSACRTSRLRPARSARNWNRPKPSRPARAWPLHPILMARTPRLRNYRRSLITPNGNLNRPRCERPRTDMSPRQP